MKWRSFVQVTAVAALLFSVSLPQVALAQGRRGGGRMFGGADMVAMLGRDPSMSDPSLSNTLPLLYRPDVQRALELSIGQKEKIDALRDKTVRDTMGKIREQMESMRDLAPEDRQTAMQQMQQTMRKITTQTAEEIDKQLATILNDTQLKRLHEIDLQWRGPMALVDPKVSKAVNATSEQTPQIAQIVQEFRTAQEEARRNSFQNFRRNRQGGQEPGGGDTVDPSAPPPGPPTPPTPEEIQQRLDEASKTIEKARKTANDKVLALLTDDQLQQWNKLTGKKFYFRPIDMNE